MTVISIQLDHLRTRLALINHKRKKSLLTVKESLGDSGRSSKSSNSLGVRRKKESVRRLLPGHAPATPSDLPDSSLLGSSPTVAADQYGSLYLRLGTVCKLA